MKRSSYPVWWLLAGFVGLLVVLQLVLAYGG
jgi:hypothetical protein